jgi:hypothetical protein
LIPVTVDVREGYRLVADERVEHPFDESDRIRWRRHVQASVVATVSRAALYGRKDNG